MQKLKMTVGTKVYYMDNVESCTETTDISDRQVHWKFHDPLDPEPKFSYFDVLMNEAIKLLAVAGKVELIEVPVQENILSTWEEKEKK